MLIQAAGHAEVYDKASSLLLVPKLAHLHCTQGHLTSSLSMHVLSATYL